MIAQAATERTRKPVFEVVDLTKVYHTGDVDVQALRGISLELLFGELAIMLGPSGSGKSTLLNILGGLDTATAGSVRFRGRELTRFADRELTLFRRNHVGFIFQFYNLISSLTARENVALASEIAPNPMKPEEALELVGLGGRMNHFPAQLSGGEQQRVAIARAVAKRPEIMLCDEPTGALDSKTGILVLEALAATNRELGTTTAIITHNASIGLIGDRVFRFIDGRIASVETNQRRLEPGEIAW